MKKHNLSKSRKFRSLKLEFDGGVEGAEPSALGDFCKFVIKISILDISQLKLSLKI